MNNPHVNITFPHRATARQGSWTSARSAAGRQVHCGRALRSREPSQTGLARNSASPSRPHVPCAAARLLGAEPRTLHAPVVHSVMAHVPFTIRQYMYLLAIILLLCSLCYQHCHCTTIECSFKT